ncbi:MAG: peptidase, partial [Acidobacteriota bacterium]|nr:peptidase [Acidobacteriota bacterium]
FGHGPDFGYLSYGSVWYGNEIWNGGRMVDYDKNGSIDEMEVLRWNDEHRAGKGDFQMWTKAHHPALGDVEVGGWNPKFYSQNPPPDMIESWASKEAMFNVYLAEQLPQVRILSASAKAAGDGTFDVSVEVTNEGLMPTALEMAKRVKMVRPDFVSIEMTGAPPAQGAAPANPARARQEIGWLKAGEKKTVTLKVRTAGSAKITIGSTRGGVDTRTIDVR